MDQVEDYCLLSEFQQITIWHHPELWDMAMHMVLDTAIIHETLPHPYNPKHDVWSHPPIPKLL